MKILLSITLILATTWYLVDGRYEYRSWGSSNMLMQRVDRLTGDIETVRRR